VTVTRTLSTRLAVIRLPSRFDPTHATAGLAGFPAVDVFGSPGELVEVGSYGRVTRLSGRARVGTEQPGGAYGFSVYWRNALTRVTRYATHLECACVEVGDRVGPSTRLGRIAPPPIGSRAGSAHVHLGSTRP
jgi:hypothetical protein